MTKIEAVAYDLARRVADANPEHPVARLNLIEHLACGFLQTLRTTTYLAELDAGGMVQQIMMYRMGDLV